jgi:PKD repeat protein
VRLDDGTSACVLGDVGGADTVWGGSATGPRVVVGALDTDGTLHVSLLDSGLCRIYDFIDGPATFSRPLVVDDVLYVVDTAIGRVHIVDLESGVVRSVGVFRAGENVELLFHQGDVIGHEPRTNRGAVIGPEGVRLLIDKSAGRPLISVVSDDGSIVVEGGGDAAVAGAEPEGADDFAGDLLIDDPVVLGVDQFVEPLDASDELVANFAFSAAIVQVGVPVVFVDESTGNPRSWTWDFGDGSNDSGPRVEHAWSEPGTYQVTLFVDREDASAARSALIEVVSEETMLAPTADFTFSEAIVAIGDSVVLTDVSLGGVTDREWDLGDGTSSTEEEVIKSWLVAGSYTVTLTVANEAGADSASATITVVDVLEPPTAVIAVDDVDVEVGEPVRLTSVSTGDVSRVSWDFGDGGFDSATEVIHTYLVEGAYTITLTASNSAGSSTTSVVVMVRATTLAPDARIAALPTIVEEGIPTTLASISLNDPDTLDWEFGDGNTGSGSPVTHTWAAAGTYVVTLTATNESGSDSTTVTVTVLTYLPPPIASFVSPASIRVGTPAEFIDTSSNGGTYLWDFGDGGSATTVPAIHTYGVTGTMDVTLTVINRNGTAEANDTVEVLPALPVAGFTSSPVAVRVDESVFFTDTSTGALTHAWDFGDATTSTEASPTHVYAAPGDYPVTLTITNSIDETDVFAATVSVDPAPPFLGPITAEPTPGVTLAPVTFTVTPAVGSGPIVSYTWDFGDGGSATTLVGTTTYTYAAAGLAYNVTVIATGALPEDVATAAVGFDVADPAPPIITMSVIPVSPELNEVATLSAITGVGSGPITSYFWDFGDGTFDIGVEVTKAWSSLGDKTVVVTATGPVGAEGQASAIVPVVAPPPPVISNASATPSPAFTGFATDFSATLGAASGPVNTWLWEFGDGSTSSLSDPSYTYTVADTYTVRVTATGPVTSDFFEFPLTVNIPPPLLTTPTFTPIVPLVGGLPGENIVSFSVGPAPGSGPITSYLWTFHNTTISTLQNPTFAYTGIGAFVVTVTASGPGLPDPDPIAITVNVYTPITANFSTSQPGPSGEDPPSPVSFTDTSSGAPAVSWAWNFGDGTAISTAQNPSHTYAASGIYNITLTATDRMGRSDVRSSAFNVQ